MQNIFHIQVVESSKERKVVQIKKEDGIFFDIQLCGLKLNIHFPNGQTEFGELISFHAIKTGLFLWKYKLIPPHLMDKPYYTYSVIDRLANRFIGLSKHLIMTFSLQRVFLWIKDSNERYETFEEAYEKSIVPTLIKNADRIEKRNYYDEEYKRIRLVDYIDRNFFYPLMSQHFVADLTEVTRQNGSWEIKITGAPPPVYIPGPDRAWPKRYDPNGSDNRKAIFILSDDYEVLEVREEFISTQ